MPQGKPALPDLSDPMPPLRRPLGTALLCACLLTLAACANQSARSHAARETRASSLAAFKTADTNSDEQLSREEFNAGFPDSAVDFDEMDTDHNGLVNFAEFWSYIQWKRVESEPDAIPHARYGGGTH
jgi:hypothetical protein